MTPDRLQNITLYRADCRDIMRTFADKQFSLAIVDPPYGLGLDFATNNGLRKGRRIKTIHARKDWNDAIPSAEYFAELHRVSKHQIIWGCNYYAQHIPTVGRIIFDKCMSTEGTAIRFSEAEIASCSLQKRVTIFRYRWNGNVQGSTVNWDNTGIDARIHPTQKPVALYKWLLKNYAKPGDTILDTHLGSGSSAIACHDMGFPLTAIEIDTDYYPATIRRIRYHQKQSSLKIFEY